MAIWPASILIHIDTCVHRRNDFSAAVVITNITESVEDGDKYLHLPVSVDVTLLMALIGSVEHHKIMKAIFKLRNNTPSSNL